MKHLLLYFLLVCVCKTSICEDWCYQSQESCERPCKGPAVWNQLNGTCGGQRQSPINIVTKNITWHSNLTVLKFTGYDKYFTSMVKNNGQTVSLDIPLGAAVSGGNLSHTYNAIQLFFHWGSSGTPGSEHTIDGERYLMELHILHIKDEYISVEDAVKDTTGQAILGFFFTESESENKNYSSFIAALSQVIDPESQARVNTSLNNLILYKSDLLPYYRYEGSHTTPGCSESVIWTVFKKPIPLSRDQLAAFYNLKFEGGKSMEDTFRPVQPRNSRVVYHSGAAQNVQLLSVIIICLCILAGLMCYIISCI